VQQDSTIESNIILSDTSVKGNQAKNQNIDIPWADPLFYIDGQLCQHVRKIYQDNSGDSYGLVLMFMDLCVMMEIHCNISMKKMD
jgi:hypothetical protein